MEQTTEHTHNLEFDLCRTAWLVDKVRSNKSYAQNVYAALCNNEFQEQEMWEVLRGKTWSCTWRYAGGIVADMRGEGGDYMDYYCSGMMHGHPDDNRDPDPYEGFVPEGTITEEVRADLAKLGWIPVVDR